MYKQQLEDYFKVKKNNMIDDICSLVEIKSVKGDAKEGMPFGEGPAHALSKALTIAACMGFDVKNHEGYVGTIDYNQNPTELGILAHLDVVQEGCGWTTQPYHPVVRDGMIFGRGTSDDKGPAMAALYAMKAVKDLGIELSKNVRLILGTDEECGSSDIAHYFKTEQAPPKVFSPDGSFPVINIEKGRIEGNISACFNEKIAGKKIVMINGGEKSNVIPQLAFAVIENFTEDEIKPVAKQVFEKTGVKFDVVSQDNKVRIDAEGMSGHASTPHNGNNAITALLELLSLLDFDDSQQFTAIKNMSKLFPHNDYNATALGIDMKNEESGDTTSTLNVIAFSEDEMTAVFDARIAIGSTKENTIDVLKPKFEENGLNFNAEYVDVHYVDKDSDFIKTLISKYEKYSGKEGYCASTGGGTYVHNIDGGVAFGCCLPGTDTHMHGPDEFVKIDELLMSAKIFAECIIEICK